MKQYDVIFLRARTIREYSRGSPITMATVHRDARYETDLCLTRTSTKDARACRSYACLHNMDDDVVFMPESARGTRDAAAAIPSPTCISLRKVTFWRAFVSRLRAIRWCRLRGTLTRMHDSLAARMPGASAIPTHPPTTDVPLG